MARKATIYKVELSVADMDRDYYETHNLTVAKHPSETDERLMVRVLAFALNAREQLEFSRSLSNALSLFENETIFTLNSDSIFNGHSPLKVLSEAWKLEIMEALLLMVPLSQTHGHNGQGDFIINKMGKIERDKAGLVYAGVQILKTRRLSKQPLKKFSLNLIWNEMISGGTAYGIEYFGNWVDVGRPECIKIVENLLNKKTYV